MTAGLTRYDIETLCADVSEWCLDRVNLLAPSMGLRSPMIRPVTTLVNNRPGLVILTPEPDRVEIVNEVARARREIIVQNTHRQRERRLGRMLLYRPEMTFSDGASEDLSRGFYDAHSQPPWDCWLAYVLEGDLAPGLICWIPKVLFPVAEAGMSANCDDSLTWIGEARVA
jgi:hypothetical protein